MANRIVRCAMLVTACHKLMAGSAALPLPPPVVPENPPLTPMVVTAGGQRLLLEHTDAKISYDAVAKTLRTNKPGWWLVNYPWSSIEGLDAQHRDDVVQALLGRPVSDIRNWWIRTPGTPPAEPDAPNGPAPFRLHPEPTFIVNIAHPDASDDNPGTADHPLRSIAEAFTRVTPGAVVHVMPGLYREAVVAGIDGTAERPILIEGIRSPDGQLPVIIGNDPAPPNAWKPVSGHPDVWRAENWVGGPAPLAFKGRRIRERTFPVMLEPWEFCQNFAAQELAFPQIALKSGSVMSPNQNSDWKIVPVDDSGFLDLETKRGVYYLSTWFWIPPGSTEADVWDPRFPEPLTGNVTLVGGFRAGRVSGVKFDAQSNLYRLWINGAPMPAASIAGEPRADTNYGQTADRWQQLPFSEGWNHIVMLIDSRANPERSGKLLFRLPKGRPATVCSAGEPASKRIPTEGLEADYITEWMVKGPLGGKDVKTERAIYLRVDGGADPNQLDIDLGHRSGLVTLNRPHWRFRGFEIRHGRQFQQRAAVVLGAPGVVFEHNIVREPEVRAITLVMENYGSGDAPVIVRGNWIVSPGSLGIGGAGDSTQLTSENQGVPPARGPVLIEHNHIADNNLAGYPRFWESGAMKLFKTSGSVLRYNTIVEGDGPGIWFDWEHYGNRIDGNLILRPMAFGIGVEASPGPNLLCNNVVIGTRAGGVWFKYALLGWSSARIWAVGNTIDGEFGIQFTEGPSDRHTRWRELPERNAAVVNNLVLGRPVSLHRGRLHPVAGNRLYGHASSGLEPHSRWPDKGIGTLIESGAQMGGNDWPEHFFNRSCGDYRFPASSADAKAGVSAQPSETSGKKIDLVSMVRYDFFGLPRLPGEAVPAGAFRIEPPPSSNTVAQLEVEFSDGSMIRLWTPEEP